MNNIEIKNNQNQNNNALWLSIGLVGGAIITYWLMRNKLNQKEQGLSQTNQEKEQELKKIQEKVQGLEQQLVKLNEELNKKNNNHSNQGFNLIDCLGQWFKKNWLD